MNPEQKYRIGIDAGSTTIKFVVLDQQNQVKFYSYQRHFADLRTCLERQLKEMKKALGEDATYCVCLTGSAGIGLSERSGLPFVQEVLASSMAMKELDKTDFTLIDLGGEDAKMVFFHKDKSPDIRMNGSCAGGTGAFVDQMATLLNITPKEMSDEALNYKQLYPIASRCGVFAKTDVQNLLSRRLPVSDISASIFNAVAMQTMTTLARGADITRPVLCTGGPLTFLPALRQAFVRVMKLKDEELIILPHAEITTARGAALSAKSASEVSVSNSDNYITATQIEELLAKEVYNSGEQFLSPLFKDQNDFNTWRENLSIKSLAYQPITPNTHYDVFMGIDSGSTTTKFLITDIDGKIIFKSYSNNEGNPLRKVEEALRLFFDEIERQKCTVKFLGSCVTGYGEDLIKAALNLDYGIVETMAHFKAAQYVTKDVSFILDIGGQDIKSIFIRNGAVANIELNESCSSGCGSFLQGFSAMMNMDLTDFANSACLARRPCDLGTRCTVFMNSKVKEALRQNTDAGDIAAGLAISVVKNCLYKVLKLQNLNKIGDNIVVQGGTFKNKAVLRALEILSGKKVHTTDSPELMGAYGCALYAIDQYKIDQKASIFAGKDTLETLSQINTDNVQCKGCTNNCQVVRFKFPNGNLSFAGNKCERIFHSKSKSEKQGENQIEAKYKYVFQNTNKIEDHPRDGKTIGIPRVLNMFENYPFWHALFTTAGFTPILSDESNTTLYRTGIFSIMSDNICFPAKLTNGHIMNLISKKVDRIFYPLVVKENKDHDRDANCFNCPVVSGYPDVIRSAVDPEKKHGIFFDTPVISFRDEEAVYESVGKYLNSLGVRSKLVKKSIAKAIEAKMEVKRTLINNERQILNLALETGSMLFVMTGRPYHIDPLINQRVAQIVTDLGVDIISDDVFREDENACLEVNYISQWTYPNRVLHAATGVARLPQNIQLIQINSFGCGPDSFLMDEASNVLNASGKNLTIIRVDEISSPGSVRLRLRSLIESLKQSCVKSSAGTNKYKPLNNAFTEEVKNTRTVMIPWFSDSLSPMLPIFFKRLGFNFQNLPKSDEETIQRGLQYGHNEVCYPATIVVGDIMKFLLRHREDRDKYVIGITQTGGQCRATNYLALIKNAMITAGFSDVPVLSINTGTAYGNEQPAFKADWKLAVQLAVKILHYSETLAQMTRAMVVREKMKGTANALMEKYLQMGVDAIATNQEDTLIKLLENAIDEYNNIPCKDIEPRVVGLIGEIYIKYNSFCQLHISEWLQERGIEVVVPSLFSFVLQSFVNNKVNNKNNVTPTTFGERLFTWGLKKYADSRDKKWARVKRKFKYYRQEGDIFKMADDASEVLNLVNQFGEGWLIAGEVMELSKMGIDKVVCLQPFGCIANHIVARGIENRLRKVCPKTGMLFLDIDSSVAKVNLENRLHFLIDQMGQEDKVG